MLYFKNFRFKTHPRVYKPAEDSFLLANNLKVDRGGTVLDVGTGVGILGLLAAVKAGQVLAIDINPYALSVSKENARLNKIENIEFRASDLFDNIDERFDLIVFNPPYLPVKDEGLLESSWSGGEKGGELINRFIDSVSRYLEPGGSFEMLVSSLNDMNEIKQKFEKNEFGFEILERKRLFFEEIYVLLGFEQSACARLNGSGILNLQNSFTRLKDVSNEIL